MIRAVISGMGGYLPEKVLTNADLEKIKRVGNNFVNGSSVYVGS